MALLDTAIKVLYPSIVVLGIYFLFAGPQPSGRRVRRRPHDRRGDWRCATSSGGAAAVRSSFRLPAHIILGLGLLSSASTALVPVLLGGSILEHGDKEFDLPSSTT